MVRNKGEHYLWQSGLGVFCTNRKIKLFSLPCSSLSCSCRCRSFSVFTTNTWLSEGWLTDRRFRYSNFFNGVLLVYALRVDLLTFQKTKRIVFRVILFAIFLIPGILQMGRYRNVETGPEYVKNVRDSNVVWSTLSFSSEFSFPVLPVREVGDSRCSIQSGPVSGIHSRLWPDHNFRKQFFQIGSFNYLVSDNVVFRTVRCILRSEHVLVSFSTGW